MARLHQHPRKNNSTNCEGLPSQSAEVAKTNRRNEEDLLPSPTAAAAVATPLHHHPHHDDYSCHSPTSSSRTTSIQSSASADDNDNIKMKSDYHFQEISAHDILDKLPPMMVALTDSEAGSEHRVSDLVDEEEDEDALVVLCLPPNKTSILVADETPSSSSLVFQHKEEKEEPPRQDTIPAVPTTSSSNSNLTTDLSLDAQVRILEFCDTASLRAMMQVNHHFRDLLGQQVESQHVWWKACCRQWNWLEEATNENTQKEITNDGVTRTSQPQLVDDLKLNVPGLTPEPTYPKDHHHHLHWSLLLSLAAPCKSSTIDTAHLSRRSHNETNTPPPPLWLPGTINTRLLLQVITLKDGQQAIQYLGRVGQGDRCIRADHPLPRPQALTRSQRRRARAVRLPSLPYRSWWYRLSHFKRHRLPRDWRPRWRPFVAPIRLSPQQLHVTPRLMSYFEVSILEPPDMHNNAAQQAECIAIGLATRSFSLHNRMPGWDPCSYGYHGDDGGIFHAQGHMERQYGPRFGAGDTVGCGVDYQRRTIFYTLNGKYLGDAFTDVMDDQDLYPVVGMDTNCPIVCHFGTDDRPFQFDLQGLLEEQHDIVRQSLMA